jgi:hypothetical protein
VGAAGSTPIAGNSCPYYLPSEKSAEMRAKGYSAARWGMIWTERDTRRSSEPGWPTKSERLRRHRSASRLRRIRLHRTTRHSKDQSRAARPRKSADSVVRHLPYNVLRLQECDYIDHLPH